MRSTRDKRARLHAIGEGPYPIGVTIAEAGDVPLDSPTTASRAIDFPEITQNCVYKSVLGARNTAPGQDEIPTAILRIAWPVIKEHVLTLYRCCLALSYHPAAFRSAILAIIPKPNKPDQTSPRAYRPIALLSVLGKGLECLLAWNISWLAIQLQIIAAQQFGALPLQSSIDLITCLTVKEHD